MLEELLDDIESKTHRLEELKAKLINQPPRMSSGIHYTTDHILAHICENTEFKHLVPHVQPRRTALYGRITFIAMDDRIIGQIKRHGSHTFFAYQDLIVQNHEQPIITGGIYHIDTITQERVIEEDEPFTTLHIETIGLFPVRYFQPQNIRNNSYTDEIRTYIQKIELNLKEAQKKKEIIQRQLLLA